MDYKNSLRKTLFFCILLLLIEEIYMEECGWAHRIERFMPEKEAMEGSWPWMVAITVPQYGTSEFVRACSGVLITRRHVLTVPSCIFSSNNSYGHRARIGHVDERLAQEYEVIDIDVHEDYNGQYYANIAIMTLSRDVFSENFNPICLFAINESVNLTGQFTTVVGWGSTTPRGQSYPKLKEKFGLLVIPNSECLSNFRRRNQTSFLRIGEKGITDDMLCTAYPNDCVGESGSPLMYQKEDQWFLAGLVSFTDDCAFAGTAIGYVRVSEYLKWIYNRTKACGFSNRGNSSFIGLEAPVKSWSWMVAITLKREDKLIHLCSGSLITSRHVLTSARCFDSTDPFLYQARIGHVDETKAPRYNISRIVFPPSYVRGDFNDDIAILTLARDVESEEFNPVCLPSSPEFAISIVGITTVGWGPARGYATDYPILREEFYQKVIPTSRCYETFKGLSYKNSNNMICTAYKRRCVGDLGSPLMNKKDGRWYMIGVLSLGYACDPHGHPAAYTRVSEYLNWIQENTKT